MEIDWVKHGIPELFLEKKYVQIPQHEGLINTMRRFLERHEKIVFYIHGEPGVGKSIFAVASLQYFVSYVRPSAKFITHLGFFRKFQETFNNSLMSAELMSGFCSCDLLVFDDLGMEKMKDWQMEKFQTLVEDRFNSRKKTIFTSNLSLEDLKEQFGDRLYRRIGSDAVAYTAIMSEHEKSER